MRKRTVIAFIAILFSFLLKAQEDSIQPNTPSRWSLRVSGGYAWPIAQQYFGFNDHFDAQNQLTRTMVKCSFGQGILSTLTCRYRISDIISLEIGAFVNQGKEINTSHYSSEVFPDYHEDTYYGVNSCGSLSGITFTQVFSKFRIGISNYFSLGLRNTGHQRDYEKDANEETLVIEHTKGMSFGWLSQMSCEYSISDHFSIGINAFVFLHSWRPKHGEIVECTFNGQDLIPSMPKEDRNFEFADVLSTQSPNPYVVVFPFSYPLHSAGAAFQVAYTF